MDAFLKHSLYASLAILTLAGAGASTVAGIGNNVLGVNANASRRRARRHRGRRYIRRHHARRNKRRKSRRYETIDQNIPLPYQQPVTQELTGTHALYNKPWGVKGFHTIANADLMRNVRNRHTFGNYFMAYRKAILRDGQVYYKVVSYNMEYRGWIKSDGIRPVTSTYAVQNPKHNRVFFKNPKTTNTYVYPIKSLIYNPVVARGVRNVAHDPLHIATVRKTYRGNHESAYVRDEKNPQINGWVDMSKLSNKIHYHENLHFDHKSEIEVKFADNGHVFKRAVLPTGATSKGTDVTSTLTQNNGPLSNNTWVNSQLAGTGRDIHLDEHANRDALQDIKSGETITLNTYKSDNAHARLDLHVEGTPEYAPIDIFADGVVNSDHVSLPNSFSNNQINTLVGDSSDNLDFNTMENAFFGQNANLASLDGTATYFTDASGHEVFVPTSDIKNHDNNSLYHYVYKYDADATRKANQNDKYGSVVNVFYSRQKVSGPANASATVPSNGNSVFANAQQVVD